MGRRKDRADGGGRRRGTGDPAGAGAKVGKGMVGLRALAQLDALALQALAQLESGGDTVSMATVGTRVGRRGRSTTP